MSKMRLFAAAVALSALIGCASKPEQEIAAAQQALEKARAAEAPAYAQAEFQKLEQSFQEAQAEIAAQDQKFALSRSYDAAKQTLVGIVGQADEVVKTAQANRETARAAAETALQDAQAALAAAQEALSKAPQGKDTRAELEAMAGDLKAAQDSLAQAQQALAAGKYLEATTALNALKAKADSVASEVAEAIARKGGRRS